MGKVRVEPYNPKSVIALITPANLLCPITIDETSPRADRSITPPEQTMDPQAPPIEPNTGARVNALVSILEACELPPNGVAALKELHKEAQQAIVRKTVSEKQNNDILAASKARRRRKSSRKGVNAKVMTIEEINKIREEAEAKENEDRIRKEVAAERAAANRLQAQIYQEVLPIHRDLIAFLKS
jgi:hypothetical protein